MSDNLDDILDDALNDFDIEESQTPPQTDNQPNEKPQTENKDEIDPDEAMNKILEMMSEDMQKFANDPNSMFDGDPESMFDEIFNELDKEQGGLDNFMDGFLKNLLSKDILYNPFKELSELYPKFLSENKETLSAEEFQVYSRQLEIINEIIKEYDGEENVDKIMSLLDDMEKCGKLPDAIVKNLTRDMPTLPGFDNPKGCTIS